MAKGGDGRTVSPDDNHVAGINGKQLLSVVQRIERLEEEKRGLADDIKTIKAEAKGTGFDVKIITFLIRQRRQDADDLAEFETLTGIYKRALGMENDL